MELRFRRSVRRRCSQLIVRAFVQADRWGTCPYYVIFSLARKSYAANLLDERGGEWSGLLIPSGMTAWDAGTSGTAARVAMWWSLTTRSATNLSQS